MNIPDKLQDFIRRVGGVNPQILTSRRLDEIGCPWAMNHSQTALGFAKAHTPFLLNLDSERGEGTHWVAVATKGKGRERRMWYADPLGAGLGGMPPEDLAAGFLVTPNLTTFMSPEANHCGYLALMFLSDMHGALPQNAEKFSNKLATAIGAFPQFKIPKRAINVSAEAREKASKRMKEINARRMKKGNGAPEIEEELKMCSSQVTPASRPPTPESCTDSEGEDYCALLGLNMKQ